ncbi:MAG TPA: hypothetical protein VGH09_05510 [Solirubrobacteraceae bacterium]
MTVRSLSSLFRTRDPATLRRVLLRALAFAALGVCAALLVSCSSSGKGLIPTGDAGPLQSDFETVAQAAETGDGSCTATESALLKTDQDFTRLPNTVDAGLRDTLRRGIENLRTRSLALCAQPLPQATTTQTTPKTATSTTSTPTTTETQTTSTQTSTPAPAPGPSGPGGGTPAPGEEAGEEESAGKGHDGAGGIGAGGNGGQEAGK